MVAAQGRMTKCVELLLILVITKREPFLGACSHTDAADGASAEGLFPLSSSPMVSRACQVKALRPDALRLPMALVFAMQICPAGPRPLESTPGARSGAGHSPYPLHQKSRLAGARRRRPQTPSAYHRGRSTPDRPSYVRCCNRTR